MISPDILKQIAEGKEDENYEFRVFLKNQDDKEVDRLVHRYHKELYSKEFCKGCMNCCKESSVELDSEEEMAAAKALGISRKMLRKQYPQKDKGESNTCIFFNQNKCLIEQVKPLSCIEYPHTQKDGFVFRLLSVIDNYSICPIVFEIYERLKNHYKEAFAEFNVIYSSKYWSIEPEPVNPNYLSLNSNMQLGYKYLYENNYNKTIATWGHVWNEIMDAMREKSLNTFKEFDEIFNGTQYVSNWINDFDICLLNIISNSNDAIVLNFYGNIRIQLNESILNFVGNDDQLTIENAQIAIAETYSIMGNTEKGEQLFENHLRNNPEWGWGWIGWSDLYWMSRKNGQDFKRGEEILLKALSVPGLRDRDCVEERLLNLYEDSGEDAKLKAWEKKLNQIDEKKQNVRNKLYSGIEKSIIQNQAISKKIGRNSPCPCGSGKKYKKCCGK